MLAWRRYSDGLHEGCGHPIATATHPDNDGWFEFVEWVTCWACTAMARAEDPSAKEVRFPVVVDTRDYDADPLPAPGMPSPSNAPPPDDPDED